MKLSYIIIKKFTLYYNHLYSIRILKRNNEHNEMWSPEI